MGFVSYSCLATVKGKETSRETYPQNTLLPTKDLIFIDCWSKLKISDIIYGRPSSLNVAECGVLNHKREQAHKKKSTVGAKECLLEMGRFHYRFFLNTYMVVTL